MPITWPLCILLQHIGLEVWYQIKAEVPTHAGKVINIYIVIDCVGLSLRSVFTYEAELF